ncbi:MAG TPA: LptA/OstA family protein [Rhizomicrobium sp.]|jgi:lipopolysaccharide export system protein LptA
MKYIRIFFAAIATGMIVMAAAQALEQPQAPDRALSFGQHNANAPINVSSDNFVGDFETKIGTYTGNVVVTQADYRLRSDSLKINVAAGKPNRFEAQGNVVFYSPSGTATGDNGIYDLGPRTVTLTGRVVLTKDKDVMRGSRLVVDMVSGKAHLTASGTPGGRVQGLFIPPPQSAQPKKPGSSGGQ